MLHPSTQYKLCVLQGLVAEQPIQFCPLYQSVAVLILHSSAVDGKDSFILKSGFHPVGIHVVATGKQFCHDSIRFISYC